MTKSGQTTQITQSDQPMIQKQVGGNAKNKKNPKPTSQTNEKLDQTQKPTQKRKGYE